MGYSGGAMLGGSVRRGARAVERMRQNGGYDEDGAAVWVGGERCVDAGLPR
jgi:hypothetical protein